MIFGREYEYSRIYLEFILEFSYSLLNINFNKYLLFSTKPWQEATGENRKHLSKFTQTECTEKYKNS